MSGKRGKNMKKKDHRSLFSKLFLAVILMLVLTTAPLGTKEANAATAGFKTLKGKTYYIKKDGTKVKGWLELNGYKYYFDEKTGVQVKGWQKDEKGRAIRYFTSGKGVMVTGWLQDSAGNTRYFKPKTGLLVRGWMKNKAGDRYYFTSGSGVMLKGWITAKNGSKRYFKPDGKMAVGWYTTDDGKARYFSKTTGYMSTGLRKIGKYYYYFSKKDGGRIQKGFTKVGAKKYYFSPKNGRAKIGWLTLKGKQYYFGSTGVMYVSTTATIDGLSYKFDANGVATQHKYVVSGNNVKIFDPKNNRSYLIRKEFIEHPGIENGEKTDLDLLAAFCEAEAGDQGLIGMEAVVLCALNRTIKADREFPSSVRHVIYQGGNFAQYSVVSDGALEKRLNGFFYDRALAYKAAKKAMAIFDDYVKNKTPRKLKGFKAKDFNYMYFMMESYYWRQPLNFSKVKNELYRDHMFFYDWV